MRVNARDVNSPTISTNSVLPKMTSSASSGSHDQTYGEMCPYTPPDWAQNLSIKPSCRFHVSEHLIVWPVDNPYLMYMCSCV